MPGKLLLCAQNPIPPFRMSWAPRWLPTRASSWLRPSSPSWQRTRWQHRCLLDASVVARISCVARLCEAMLCLGVSAEYRYFDTADSNCFFHACSHPSLYVGRTACSCTAGSCTASSCCSGRPSCSPATCGGHGWSPHVTRTARATGAQALIYFSLHVLVWAILLTTMS